MKRMWKPMLIVGIFLLIATVIVLPFLITETVAVEGFDYIDTPFEWFAERYCRFMLSGNLWIWLLAVGVVLTVGALWMHAVQKKT